VAHQPRWATTGHLKTVTITIQHSKSPVFSIFFSFLANETETLKGLEAEGPSN
jgi:hypothetical protein